MLEGINKKFGRINNIFKKTGVKCILDYKKTKYTHTRTKDYIERVF
jgi:hypothetical protein